MPKTTTLLLFVTLFVLVDVGTAHAQCSSLSSAQDISNDIYSAMALSSIGLAISFAFVGIAFMVGEIFAIEGFRNWYKQDLWETTKSVILVVAIFSLLAISSALALALAGVPAPASSGSSVSSTISSNLNALYAADLAKYICNQESIISDAFAGILGLHIGITALSSMSISAYIPIPIPFVGSFDIGFYRVKPFNSHMITGSGSGSFTDVIADEIVVPTMIIFQVLENYFYIIMYTGLLVFIPIGVFLRAIPFLRGLGGMMLAEGITLSLVFPMLLLTFNLPVSDFLAPLTVPSSLYNAGQASCSSSVLGSGNPTYEILGGMVCTGMTAILNTAVSWISGTQGFLAGLGTFFSSSPSIYPAMNFITNFAMVALIQFILLIFDVIIAFAIGDSIAKMLGAPEGLKLGVGKLKLV